MVWAKVAQTTLSYKNKLYLLILFFAWEVLTLRASEWNKCDMLYINRLAFHDFSCLVLNVFHTAEPFPPVIGFERFGNTFGFFHISDDTVERIQCLLVNVGKVICVFGNSLCTYVHSEKVKLCLFFGRVKTVAYAEIFQISEQNGKQLDNSKLLCSDFIRLVPIIQDCMINIRQKI